MANDVTVFLSFKFVMIVCYSLVCQSSQCISILFEDILHVMLAHRVWNHLLGLKWITGNRSTFTRNVESQKANLHFSTLPSVAYLIWDVLSYTFIIMAHSNFLHPTNWMLFKMWSLSRCVLLSLNISYYFHACTKILILLITILLNKLSQKTWKRIPKNIQEAIIQYQYRQQHYIYFSLQNGDIVQANNLVVTGNRFRVVVAAVIRNELTSIFDKLKKTIYDGTMQPI